MRALVVMKIPAAAAVWLAPVRVMLMTKIGRRDRTVAMNTGLDKKNILNSD